MYQAGGKGAIGGGGGVLGTSAGVVSMAVRRMERGSGCVTQGSLLKDELLCRHKIRSLRQGM